jgi:hypothetical protein
VDQRGLVEQAQRGDHDAFALLARAAVLAAGRGRHAHPAGSRARAGRGPGHDDRAWRNLPGLRDPDRFDAWIHRLLVRACIDSLRRRRSRPFEVELRDSTGRRPPTSLLTSQIASSSMTPSGISIPLRGPSSSSTTTSGCPCPKRPAALGIPVGTAKSRLHRSLAVMRSAIVSDAAVDIAPFARGHLP